MTPDELAAIAARCKAATPGPWHVEGSEFDEDCREHIAPHALVGPDDRTIWSSGGGEYRHPDMATAQFIAHAREDVAALVERVEALEAERTAIAVQLQRLAPTWSHETKSWTMRQADDGPYTLWSAAAETIRAAMWERDEAKKEAAESSKEMIMLFNDHSSIELEKQLRIEQLVRERDKFQALAELGDGYRRERDDLRAWQVQIAEPLGYLVRAFGVGGYDVAEPSVIMEAWRALERERDEARARLEETEHAMHMRIRAGYDACVADAWRAEVQRLTDERDELLVRVADQGAELRATREAYRESQAELTRERIGIRPVDEVRCDAYRRGAEAMRGECIGAACGFFMGTTGFCNGDEDELEAVLEALPIPEEP
jgi:hypothetical protein